MIKANWKTVFTVASLCGLATVLLLTSLITEKWVTAEGRLKTASIRNLSTVNYGLFSGKLVENPHDEFYFPLDITCLANNNTCAFLCGETSRGRQSQLEKLLRGENVSFEDNCPKPLPKLYSGGYDKTKFLNAGLYITTCIFLSVSLLFGLFATVGAYWIAFLKPKESYLMYGVFVHTIVAFVAAFITLITWGVLFRIDIEGNLGILYTITGDMDTTDLVKLGLSYWLLIPSCIFYLLSAAVVYKLQRIMRKASRLQQVRELISRAT